MKEINTYYDILEFAIAKEQQAYYLFMALAKRVQDPEICKAFEGLAKEELDHKAKLEMELVKKGKMVSPAEEEMDDFRVSDYVVAGEEELDIDYKDLLLLGTVKEDASFRLYIDLVARAKDEESKEILLALAQEEVRHKMRFETEYEQWLKENEST